MCGGIHLDSHIFGYSPNISVHICRMQDVLPIVAYTEAIALESEQAETCVQEV